MHSEQVQIPFYSLFVILFCAIVVFKVANNYIKLSLQRHIQVGDIVQTNDYEWLIVQSWNKNTVLLYPNIVDFDVDNPKHLEKVRLCKWSNIKDNCSHNKRMKKIELAKFKVEVLHFNK